MHARGSFDLHTSLMNKDRYGNEIMKLKDFEEGTHLGTVGFWLNFPLPCCFLKIRYANAPCLMVFVGWCRYTTAAFDFGRSGSGLRILWGSMGST